MNSLSTHPGFLRASAPPREKQSSWQTMRLGEVCGFVRGPFGGSLKKNVFVSDGFAVYEQQHAIYNQFDDIRYFIDDAKFREMQRFELHSNDLIMSCSGTMGRVAIVPENIRRGIINQALLKLTPIDTVLPEFLKYWMDSSDFQDSLKEQSGGAAIQNVASVGILKEIRVSLPPLGEQRRIVGILDRAFAGIATAQANAEKNRQNAHALFESHLNSVFTQRGKGWVEKKLNDVCAIASNLIDPRKKEFLESIHVGAGNIESKTGAFIDLKTAQEEGLISGKYPFDETTVLYSKIRPYLMKVARPGFTGVCSADMYPLKPVLNEITRDFLFYLLLSKDFTDYAIQGSARAGMPKVNREHLFEFKAWLPDVKIQKELAANLDDLHEETQRLAGIYERKLAGLAALKKSLLHRAFAGEL